MCLKAHGNKNNIFFCLKVTFKNLVGIQSKFPYDIFIYTYGCILLIFVTSYPPFSSFSLLPDPFLTSNRFPSVSCHIDTYVLQSTISLAHCCTLNQTPAQFSAVPRSLPLQDTHSNECTEFKGHSISRQLSS